MGGTIAVAIDDGDLPVGVIGVVLLEHPHHVHRAVALRQKLDRQRIVAAIGEGLRLADADAGQDSFAASAGADREGRDAEAEPAGVRAARDDRDRHLCLRRPPPLHDTFPSRAPTLAWQGPRWCWPARGPPRRGGGGGLSPRAVPLRPRTPIGRYSKCASSGRNCRGPDPAVKPCDRRRSANWLFRSLAKAWL